MNEDELEPLIVGFCCNWCSYAAADFAGVSRMQYAPNIRIIRVMCGRRASPLFVLKALGAAADAVLSLGCQLGDCHYVEGNYKALRRMALLKKMLPQLGIEDERVRLDWVSASEAAHFASILDDVTEKVRVLGPLKLNSEGRPTPQPPLSGDGR